MTKEKLIDKIVSGANADSGESDRYRQWLLTLPVIELDRILDEQNLERIRAEAARQVQAQQYPQLIEAQQQVRAAAEKLMWSRIFGTVINGRVAVDNQASRSIIQGWLDLDEQITVEWFNRILAENPGLAKSLTWQSADALDPRKKAQAAAAQAEADHETFSRAARKYGIGETEANFGLIREVLGSGFSEYQVGEAVTSGAVRVSPATQEELAAWAQEAAELRQDFLINEASPEQLREAVRQEAEQRRAQFQQQEAERRLAARAEADKLYGYDPLPTHNLETNEVIDAAYLNRLSVTNLPLFKRFLLRYGNTQLTNRLRGIA